MTQQQYTPVSWQDETTSQQGTLINAERLNQMQTAHHYADGLEETDTVPTADPGVDYHKVVYCTADNTLYRWDGEAWTADIDDPTRELLEEHEADHDNPHQVTKAQVGLGNADNTSDMDKPISTATQTALNAKADKSDTYTKAQVDTALALKADKATTYTKTEIDTVMATKADKATTLAGYGITDAYTKTEADTLLGAKADQATTYTKSEVQTYVSNALDGYLPMVRTTGNQIIAGIKTFSAVSINTTKWRIKNANEGISTVPSAQVQTQPKDIVDANDAQIYFEQLLTNTDGSRAWRQNLYGTGGHRKILHMQVEADGSGYVTAPWRTYNTANTDDVVTIGTLKASTDVVHTSGIEDIAGDKRFLANMSAKKNTVTTATAPTNSQFWGLVFTDKDNKEFGGLRAAYTSSRDNYLYLALRNLDTDTQVSTFTFFKTHMTGPYRAYNASNVNDVATIGTLDAYTPMVRTTGNQDIAGIKTFNNAIYTQGLSILDVGSFSKAEVKATYDLTDTSVDQYVNLLNINDKNGLSYGYLQLIKRTTGERVLRWVGPGSSGTTKYIQIIATG